MIKDLLGGIWPKLLAALGVVLGLLVLVGKLLNAGRAQEQAKQGAAAAARVKEASDVANAVDRAADAERQQLRNKWTRP